MCKCHICGKVFSDPNHLRGHISIAHPPSTDFKIKQHAFQKSFLTYQYNYPDGVNTLEAAQNDKLVKGLIKTVKYETVSKNSIRVGLILIGKLITNLDIKQKNNILLI